MYCLQRDSYLAHHGIKGQKWGVRRYQNEDGSLTSAGRSRYGYDESGFSSSRSGSTRGHNGGINPGRMEPGWHDPHISKDGPIKTQTPEERMRGDMQKISDFAKSRRERRREARVERGARLTRQGKTVAGETGKAIARNVLISMANVGMNVFAGDAHTRGVVNAGTIAALALSNTVWSRNVKAIDAYNGY